jgi:transcriptional regulator of nitric oxide reductase
MEQHRARTTVQQTKHVNLLQIQHQLPHALEQHNLVKESLVVPVKIWFAKALWEAVSVNKQELVEVVIHSAKLVEREVHVMDIVVINARIFQMDNVLKMDKRLVRVLKQTPILKAVVR